MSEYNYMNEVAVLIDSFESGNPSDEEVETLLIRKKDKIKEISDYVSKTPLFEHAKDIYCDYITDAESKENPLMHVWKDFIVKVYHAPTQMHLRGVVIHLIPAMHEFLQRKGGES